MTYEVVDLFCGIGGLSYGFRAEGFRVVAGFDIDGTCRHAYEKNIGAPFLTRSVTDVSADELAGVWSGRGFRVLIGCAPCQKFSIYTGRYRRDETRTQSDERWLLLEEYSRLIEATLPDVISMENVVRVKKHPAFATFVERLQRADYVVSHFEARAQDYGVPQKRKRLVLFASRHGKVELEQPDHSRSPVTVRQAIGSLPRIAAGEADPADNLHVSRGLTSINLSRIRATAEGGSWKDWDPSLRLACHDKQNGKSFRAVYGRMNWDEAAPVITTQCIGIGNGRFGHPEQDRAISIREAAILQSFPVGFDFVPVGAKINGLQLARQIGNAVPPLLAQAVARSIRKHLVDVGRLQAPA